ncbi:hypothetical protein AX16_004669 [Volvariella volvacea WC 439]|nr:hypothetical protein AX16_004669 [Volvariella volvacea WC 439]
MSQTIDYPTVVLPTSASTSDLPQQPPPLNTPSRSSSRSSLNHNTHTSLSPPMLPFITTSLSAPGPSTSANTYANAHASLNGSRATSLRARSSMMGFGNIDSARTSVTHVAPYDETMFLQAQEPDFGLEGGAEPESEILQVDARARPASGVDGSSAFTPTPPTPHRDADAASPVLPGAGPSSQLGAHDHDQSTSSLLPTPRPPQIVTSYSSSPSSLPSSSQQESTHPHVQSPQTTLTFLLITGQRKIMSFDPETTVGRVKELVWNAWPNGEFISFLFFARFLPVFAFASRDHTCLFCVFFSLLSAFVAVASLDAVTSATQSFFSHLTSVITPLYPLRPRTVLHSPFNPFLPLLIEHPGSVGGGGKASSSFLGRRLGEVLSWVVWRP